MKFSALLDSYVAAEFGGSEALHMIEEFKKHIPARILQMEFDASRSNKQGIKDGERVYKLGLDLAASTAFIEYLENFNQTQPSMALYVCKANKSVAVNGRQSEKTMTIRFDVRNGSVQKSVKIN